WKSFGSPMASRVALGLSFCADATALDRRTPGVRRTANCPSEMLMISLQREVVMGRSKQERSFMKPCLVEQVPGAGSRNRAPARGVQIMFDGRPDPGSIR